MGRLQLFTIQMDNPDGVYSSGQRLQGNVLVHLNADLPLRGIRVTLFGGASVYWTETTGTGDSQKTDSYSAKEDYFHVKLTLLGKSPGQSGNDLILPAGHHAYPFSMQLPEGLPASFKGGIGSVRYFAKATVDRPGRPNYKTKCAFTVVSTLDLNTQENAMMSFTQSKQKTLCCLCCRSGPISATLSIPRLGYVPGESIPIFAEITNLSDRSINCSKVELVQSTEFHATFKTETRHKKIASTKKGKISVGGSEIWSGEVLEIPPVPPSYLPGCKIIEIHYLLKLVVEPSGASTSLVIPVEIVIGTIPLRDAFQQPAS